jgi:hypothetical protein
MARKIKSRGEPGVLLKLDISRAFDSLSWSFLLEVLLQLGFPEMCIRWIAILLKTATTRISVNGVPGNRIAHARGLRQGDPLSPQLFVLAMEVVTLLICRAAEQGLLSGIGNCNNLQRLSIYADDVVLFAKPTVQDLVAVREIFRLFGRVSGLHVNYAKTSATVIRGGEQTKDLIVDTLRCSIKDFPIKYLGLQLALRPLTKAQWQPLIDATTHLVPAWQRGLIAKPGRLVLIKAVMCARPTHNLLISEAPAWLIQEVEKRLRGFFWAGSEKANGGQCLVAWDQLCKPLEYGGLGIKDLKLQGLALRVRWQWLLRTDTLRPWQGLPLLKDAEARALFDSLIRIDVGDGGKVLFWRDRWIDGRSAADFAPGLCLTISARICNSRTVEQAMINNRWFADIPGTLATRGARELITLWAAVNSVQRHTDSRDSFTWPWTASGQ